MAEPPLTFGHAFGLSPVAHNNVVCVDDTHIAFPVGRHISVTNAETRASVFLMPEHFDKVQQTTALAISPNRKYIACAELVAEDEPAQVSVFALATGKRQRILSSPVDVNVFQWRSLAFSADGKVLVALGDAPDYLLAWWQWDKSGGKLLGYAKVGQPAFRVALSRPADGREAWTCAVCGPKLMRFFKIGEAKGEGAVKAINASVGKRELLDFSDLCWLDDERLLACATTGEVAVFEAQELKQVLVSVHPGSAPLRCIIPCAKGFIVAGDRGLLSVHERTEDNAFVPLKHFVCQGALSRMQGSTPGNEKRPDAITALALAPSEDVLYTSSGDCQLSAFPFKDMDILRTDGVDDHFAPISGAFHQGAVTGMDVCTRKPLIATCSADRTVRVWDYAESVCVQSRVFVEEPLSVAFHPSGYHLLIGFADKLRFYHVLVDELRLVKEFHLKMCREVRFANGGHLFAAAAGPNVLLYGTYTLEPIGTLKGHAGPVRSLGWSADDLAIVTCGVDGAVYEWAVDGLQRVEDHVLKSCQYNAVVCAERGGVAAGGVGGVVATASGGAGTGIGGAASGGAGKQRPKTRILAGSNDGKLRELHAGQVGKELSLSSKATQLVLTAADRVTKQHTLVVGQGNGVLASFNWPLDEAPSLVQAVHRGAITRLRLSADGAHLFSAGEDGAVFVFLVRGAEREALRRAGAEQGEGNGNTTEELEKQLSDQELQAHFKLHQREAEFARGLKKEKDDAASRSDEAAARYELLARTRDRNERETGEKERATEVAHMRAAEELEHLYERKLAAEAARYESLSQQKADMQSAFEERMLTTQGQHTQELENYQNELESVSREAERTHADLRGDKEGLKESYEEELAQEDRDYEDEVGRMKRGHETHLQAERDEALKLKGEAAILRKKFETSRTDMQKLSDLADSDKMVAMLRKDMRDREDTIADKERRMAELKGKNKELEKFKYVLDYKLRELKKELEPRDEALSRMRSTVTELDDELQRDFKHNVSLSQEVGEQQAKIDSLSRELKRERRLLAERERLISSFGRDLHRLVTHTEPQLWRDAIKDIYRTYVASKSETGQDALADGDAADHEIHRQREYMERAIDTLKDKRTSEQKRKVGENQTLLNEVNEMRVENKELK
ncbi:quinon protein alcohol dehydrogenase-like superfamily, partial [Pavlovales sp. CCMP2436]